MNKEFVEFLVSEMQTRGWTKSEFSRRAGLSPATVSRVVAMTHAAGDDFVVGTARAFGMPTESVMRIAGKLPDLGEVLPEAREWSARLKVLPPDRRQAVIQAIENILFLADFQEPVAGARPDQTAPKRRGGRPKPAQSSDAA